MSQVYLKLFPTPETRPRQREVLIEIYRKGEITEALRAFKEIYLEVVDQLIDHLKSRESEDSSFSKPLQSTSRSGDAGARTRDLAEKSCLLSARVQAHRLSSVLAQHEGVPRAMDHHSSGCLPAEKFPYLHLIVRGEALCSRPTGSTALTARASYCTRPVLR